MIRLLVAVLLILPCTQGCQPPSTAKAATAGQRSCDTGLLLEDDFEYATEELTDHGWVIDEELDNCIIDGGYLTDDTPTTYCELRQPICVDALHAEFEMRVGMNCNYNCWAQSKLFADSEEYYFGGAGTPSILLFGPHWRREIYHFYDQIEGTILGAMGIETRFAYDVSSPYYAYATHVVEYRDGLVSYRVDDDLLLDELRVAEPGVRLQASEIGVWVSTTNPYQETRIDSVKYTVYE